MTEPQPVSPKIQLIRYTPHPDQLVASAAKLCYASDTELVLDQTDEKAANFVRRLKKLGHMSPIEHVSFTFYIEGISRACTHQLVRHRIASYSQRSQRYVKHDSFEYIIPPQLEGKKLEIDGVELDVAAYYHETMKMLSERYSVLNKMLGDTGETSNEDARYILPNACETKIFMTVNARELLHIFEERLCLRAQWEIRRVTDEMLALVKPVCPAIFENAGPKCVRLGYCPEGKMTCGKFKEMIGRYAVSSTDKHKTSVQDAKAE
ncbi:MAG: FAD-dependent thymidylate synthase [Lentisphaerae bacterium]|nr:FAD-dependent thymidylate synthase [Lentisphaerota bacterium]